jgi:hypothetical protein
MRLHEHEIRAQSTPFAFAMTAPAPATADLRHWTDILPHAFLVAVIGFTYAGDGRLA